MTNPTIGGREIWAAKIAIVSAREIPERTGLRIRYYANLTCINWVAFG